MEEKYCCEKRDFYIFYTFGINVALLAFNLRHSMGQNERINLVASNMLNVMLHLAIAQGVDASSSCRRVFGYIKFT